MKHTEQLKLLLMIQGMVVKVADRIRHLQTQTPAESSGRYTQFHHVTNNN